MNRTIEQWQEVVGSGQHTSVLGYAVQDMQKLARQLDELVAALEAMLEVHGVTQKYADTHIEIPQCWVDVSDIARAALKSIKEQTK